MKKDPRQPSLFGFEPGPSAGTRDPAPAPFAQALAEEHARAAELAQRLPPGLHFGTSSWSFPGWAGLVWSRRRSTAALARDGLSEYARHPLLTTVGIDRSYYAPIPDHTLEGYARQLPQGFPCCAKAPAAVTSAVDPQAGSNTSPRRNSDFLRPERLATLHLEPLARSFAAHLGPIILQLPPVPARFRPRPAELCALLEPCLRAAASRGLEAAVELRDPALLAPPYAATLERCAAAHVFNYASDMPSLAEQARLVPAHTAPFVVIRLLLRPGTRYEERRGAFTPFDRLQDPDEAMRGQVVRLIEEALRREQRVYVLVNNKAEGSAPLTIRALAELVTGAGLR